VNFHRWGTQRNSVGRRSRNGFAKDAAATHDEILCRDEKQSWRIGLSGGDRHPDESRRRQLRLLAKKSPAPKSTNLDWIVAEALEGFIRDVYGSLAATMHA
jgi:hypothetical protein